jgi:CRP-like cAMP-binding protein
MTSSALMHALRAQVCPALTIREAEHIASATVPHRIRAGANICDEGDLALGLIFILDGTAEVIKDRPGSGSQLVAVLQSPIMVGEVGLLTGDLRSATVRARTDCECHVLTRSQFERLLEEMSPGAYKLVLAIAALLARRLAAMNEQIIALPDV